MRGTRLLAAMAAGTFLCACTTLTPPGTATTRVSAHYEAAGDVSGLRAFVYGKRTVLEFSGRPLWLTVQDENGVAVPYEREGRYYRLSRRLERFTVRASARVVAFGPVSGAAPATAGPGPASAGPVLPVSGPKDALPAVKSPVTISAKTAPEDDMTALLRLSAAQHDEVRRAVARAGATGASMLTARLDRMQARSGTATSVMIRVQFDTAATRFEAGQELVRTLLAAARAAERIIVRGRTDARVAGRDDSRIARERALAARRFLVEHGVDGSRIRMYSLPAGDFLAPAGTGEGRALNRRVEIELFDLRHAALKRQPETLQGTAP